MPAKEQVSETQVKENTQNDESLSNSSSTQGSPTGLIHKIYDAVLSRDVVKNGVKTIKAKYHDVLVEGGKQIHVIKSRGEQVYINTRERVKTWAYSITIYNQFTSLWLIKNLPFGSQKVVTFEEFLSSFQVLSKDHTKESEHLAKSFYKHAHQLWEGLKEPELEDIKQCCLNIVAQSVAVEFKIEVHGFAHLLVELFKSLDSKQAEVITNEYFYLQIHRKITHKIHNEHEFRKATDTFYTFAKRFAFLEFPLTYANQDILRVLVKFAQEKLEIVAEVFLNRVDGLLNIVIKKLGYEYEQKEAPVSLLDKYNRIVEKLVVVSSNSYNKTRLAIQESKAYQYADKRVHFEDRYNDLVRVSKQIFDTASVKLTPVVNAITLQYNKITKEYVFTLYDVSRELVKENYAGLKKRYSALKDATLKLRDNILEIKLNKETFEKLSAEAKEQIALIYAEVRGLNYEKLKVYGGKAYQRAVEAVRNGVKAIKSRGHHSAEKPAVKEEPKKTEEQPKKVEEQPKKAEEEPKKVEEQPKQVEESPKKVEEEPKQVEESPKKEEESPQKQEESSPEKEPEDEEEHHSENNEEEDQ